jgi:hypothetical protein
VSHARHLATHLHISNHALLPKSAVESGGEEIIIYAFFSIADFMSGDAIALSISTANSGLLPIVGYTAFIASGLLNNIAEMERKAIIRTDRGGGTQERGEGGRKGSRGGARCGGEDKVTRTDTIKQPQ